MTKVMVELVKYDMDKTKKRKRKNLLVTEKSEASVIEKLERIHKGEKVQHIHEIIWGELAKDIKPPKKRVTGFVKFFDKEKGFGFIELDKEGDDLFFHVSALGGEEIFDNDDVEFEISTSPKGKVATAIKYIGEVPEDSADLND